MNTKKLLVLLLFLPFLFIYTNMGSSNASVARLLRESEKLSLELEKSSFSKTAKGLILNHKRLVSNMIASKMKLNSCEELIDVDPNSISGPYLFYNKNGVGVVWKCLFSKGRLVNKRKVNVLVKPQVCDGFESCTKNKIYKKKVRCESENNKKTRCNIKELVGVPVFKRQLSSSSCRLNHSYGFDIAGIWVKKGCRAEFEILFRLHAGLRNMLSYKKTIKLNSLPTEGHNSSRILKLRNRLDKIKTSYKAIRSGGGNSNAIFNKEGDLIEEAEHSLQELVHLNRYRSCQELSSSEPSHLTGSYYFYSYEESFVDRRVKSTLKFCDFTTLVKDRGVGDRGTYNGEVDRSQTEGRTFLLQVSPYYTLEPQHYFNWSQDCRWMGKDGDEEQRCNWSQKTIGFEVPVRCIPKKAVEYTSYGPHSFVKPQNLGNIVYKKNGARYCFKKDEDFIEDYDHLVHGYEYRWTVSDTSSFMIDEIDIDQLISSSSFKRADASLNYKNLTWTNMGDSYEYSLDIKTKVNGKEVFYGPCVGSSILRKSESINFNQICRSAEGMPLIKYSESQVRICSAFKGHWGIKGKVKCSGFQNFSGKAMHIDIPDRAKWLRWRQLGSSYHYSLDVKTADGKTYRPCLDGGVLKNRDKIFFNRYCASAPGGPVVGWKGSTFRICAARNGNWKVPGMATCSSYYSLNNPPARVELAHSKDCTIANGMGEKFVQGNSWSRCQVKTCNSGFHQSGNSCQQNTKLAWSKMSPEWRYNVRIREKGQKDKYCLSTGGSNSFTIQGKCANNSTFDVSKTDVQIAYLEGKVWRGLTPWVNLKPGNQWISHTPRMACNIPNGKGEQVWNHKNKSWGSCKLQSCDGGFHQLGDSCQKNTSLAWSKPKLGNWRYQVRLQVPGKKDVICEYTGTNNSVSMDGSCSGEKHTYDINKSNVRICYLENGKWRGCSQYVKLAPNKQWISHTPRVQCNVNNGVGFNQWNYSSNRWNGCRVQSCNNGFRLGSKKRHCTKS